MAVALITGTSTGIGYETALALARAGHRVYATMRSPERAPELGNLAAQEKLPITVHALDVTEDESVAKAFERVLAEQGRIDVLVNNAGLSMTGPVEELGQDAFRQSMETNFFGALRCVQKALPLMREQRGGCIVNVSSVAGRVATAPQGPYCASKFALEALSEVLAQEVRSFNIRVAIVEPGVIQTPIVEKLRQLPEATHYPHERRSRALLMASLARPILPSVVAEQILAIIDGDSWQLRYPVGPDAKSLFVWRRMMSDEDWVERNGEPDDEAWCARMQQEFGIDLRPFLKLA